MPSAGSSSPSRCATAWDCEELTLVPVSGSARLVDEAGSRVATGKTQIDDETVFGLTDQGRR